MQKGKVFFAFLLCLMFVFFSFFHVMICLAQEQQSFASICDVPAATTALSSSTSAKACALIETSTGRVLYSKNQNQKLPMASTTKIMTAITAIENCADLDEKFEISPKAVGISGTSLYMRNGDIYSTRELLYALMLISANDASVAIAEHVGGTTTEFVTLMNETAKKIGATSSHFANTHGLDEDGHYTTALDLAKIAAYALENDTFKEIVSTKNIKITNGKNDENRYLKNKNKLLSTLDGCIGVKTGFTDDAGRCLVSAIEKNGMRLVCVVLNCGPMFEESAALLAESAEKYKIYDLTKFYDYNRTLEVSNGRVDSVEIGTTGTFLFPLTLDELERLQFVYEKLESVEAPISGGTEVGTIQIYLDENLLFSENIVIMKNVKPKSLGQRLGDFIANW